MTDIERFQYFLSSLTSQALSLLEGIPLTTQNYLITFDISTKSHRYKCLLANSFWQEITNIPELTHESVEEMRRLLDTFAKNLSNGVSII